MTRTLIIATLALVLAAAPQAAELAVTPNPALAGVNGSIQFTAASDSIIGAVTWQVVPPAIGTITPTGLFTASAAPGQGLVRAVAVSGGRELVGHAYLRVARGDARRLQVTVTPLRAMVAVGAVASFTARCTDLRGNAADAAIAWSVVPAELGSIDANGTFTAARPGSGRIVALARTDSARGLGQARLAVTASGRPNALTVRLTPKRAALAPNATVSLSASVSDAQGRPVTARLRYQVEPAALGTIDGAGLFTAGAKAGVGIVRVRAEYGDAAGADRAMVVIGRATRRWTVRLKPRHAELKPAQAIQFVAEAVDQDGNQLPQPAWRWQVIPERLGTITPDGLFTAGTTPMAGRIVAQLPSELGRGSDAVAVRIRPGAPNIVRIDPAKQLLKPGASCQFTATVTGPDGQPRPGASVTWQVAPRGLGTITPQGFFTASQTGPMIGAVVALVPQQQGGGRGHAIVEVSNYVVQIDGARPRYLAAGTAVTFTAQVRDAGGNTVSNAVLEWSCSSLSPSFGAITPAGQFTAGRPLVAQVDGTVKVLARLNGIVIGGDGIHVIVHR